jgi:tetratricopeptide (TPR) repeat protein
MAPKSLRLLLLKKAQKQAAKARATDEPPAPGPATGARRLIFRALAVVVVPLAFLLCLELGLRLAGYGYPTRFLVKREIGGQQVYVENEKFGFLFFSPGVARSPTPIVMPAKKAPNTSRIFLFGESAALGDPKPAYGLGRYVETLLNARYPAHHFEVICAAMTAINSHALLPVARECAKYDGDVWLIYMGNNEMIGPFGATGVLGQRTPDASYIRALLALKRTKIGQLIESTREWLTRRRGGKEWSGLKMFSGHEVGPSDPARQKVEENFSTNLRDMITAGQKAGVKIITCSVASNLKDCGPHASMHPAHFPDEQAWNESYHAAVASSGTNCPEAMKHFSAALKLDPHYAEAEFRRGQCQEQLTNRPAALEDYRGARDDDALPFRATGELNRIIASTTGQGVHFIDLAGQIEPEGRIPGNDLFFDHVHFNENGNYHAGLISAEAVARELAPEMKAGEKGEWLSAEACEARLALTDWNRALALESMLARLSDAPYTNQITNPGTRRQYAEDLLRLRERMKTADLKATAAMYTNAIGHAPSDYYLRQNYAEFLELSGNVRAALNQWQKIEELIPQHPIAFYQAGRLLNRAGDYKTAESDLRKALAIRFDFAEASIELGKALTKQGRPEEALRVYAEAMNYNPENAGLHFQRADSLAALKRRDEALDELREAIRLHPRYWEAHYFLGVELASREQVPEATREFLEVVRIKPDFALGHLNLGVALAREHRFADAARQFEQTLKLDPNNASARKNLEAARSFLREP